MIKVCGVSGNKGADHVVEVNELIKSVKGVEL